MQNREIRQKIRKYFLRKFNENFEKSKFSIFRKFLIFLFRNFHWIFEKIFFENFWVNFPHFARMSPRLSELFSKLEWYFCSRFFCATRYRLVVYGKNCLGTIDAINNYTFEVFTFFLRIFPNPRSTYLESVIRPCFWAPAAMVWYV